MCSQSSGSAPPESHGGSTQGQPVDPSEGPVETPSDAGTTEVKTVPIGTPIAEEELERLKRQAQEAQTQGPAETGEGGDDETGAPGEAVQGDPSEDSN